MANINDIKEWLAEVLGIETYDGPINEFVDWITGVDSYTNRSVSGGKPISGGSIRQLLQERLQQPIVVYDDEQAGLYRLFSSTTARDRWISGHNPQDPSYDPEGTDHLEIFNFERPSEFLLGTNLSSDPRYIIKGDEESNAARLSFNVTLKDKDGQTKSDSIIVTYTIINNITGIVQTFSEPYSSSYVNNADNPVTVDLYKYLDDGINSVNVNVKGTTVSNSIDVGFSVYFISFELSSTFDFNVEKKINTAFDVPFEINRSSTVSGSILEVKVYVDGVLARLDSNGAEAKWNTDNTASRINGTLKIRNNYQASSVENPHVMHDLRIEATMISGNTIFNSNTIYYTFEVGSVTSDFIDKFVNIGISMPYNKTLFLDGAIILQGTQYAPFIMDWSYYTDQINNFQSIPVTWSIENVVDGESEFTKITTTTARKRGLNTLNFVPEISISAEDEAYLVAMYDEEIIDKWPLRIEQSNLSVVEATGYNMKLNAYGRSNASPDKNIWRDEVNNVNVNFTGVTWDSKAGWDENSFFTIGTDSYARVGYVPFPRNFGDTGRTIEVDFKSEQVNSDDDILIDIGYASAGRIVITPVKASVLLNGAEVVSTHYKANERIKLAFIFNKNAFGNDSNLVYIVNNGILERAAGIGNVQSYVNVNGIFKIGGSQSGVRVYILRAYAFALTYTDAYNNFVFDSDNKGEIMSRNNIVDSGYIVYDECSKKIDTVLIEGDLTKILSMDYTDKKDTETTVNITRFCIDDATKSFTCVNGMIRKHGQSTLNYPITSLKFWLNKSATDGVNSVLTLSSVQAAMRLNKNRYIMKDGAIPCNKFVLQANYADSSGANNGSLERLIQDTWYNAVIDNEYKLRTAPQLFTSGEIVHHNDEDLNERGDNQWVEGYGEGAANGKTWPQISSKPFPYVVRNAPDSFPCAVFYRNTAAGDTSVQFLGQYVFMDDKKSDYLYGERSIYHYYDETDPFCLKIDNSKEDKAANRVWNNKDVLRIEVVLLNNTLTSYLNYNVQSASTDPVNRGAMVPCDTIKYDERGNKVKFYWEDYFEMIYPDPDDFTVEEGGKKVPEDKFAPNSQFRQKAQVFLDFMTWITNIASLNVGQKLPGQRITQAVLDEFKRTACEHLDMYKLAAYYIFFLRFGLVDSVERNAQLKTYDGQHWHYEPWDMDIAVGNKNTGGFTFDPPMNRNTTLPSNPSEYAYSGRTPVISNLLWDCLEGWGYWMDTVVPKVAQALYKAGLSYNDATALFDNEYSQKWSEVMYNYSGHYKYIDMRRNNNDWLLWLQGASISHRHWWLSKSMNYYDAMWSVGDFNNHRVYLNVTKAVHSSGTDLVTIKPTSSTFFKMTQSDGTASLGTLPATRENPAVFDVSGTAFEGKDPTHIYGATFIEELDLSCFAKKMGVLTLTAAYDEILGAPIKVLNIGIPMTRVSDTQYEGFVSGTTLALSASGDMGDALGNIKTLDITGQQSISDSNSLLYDNNRRTLVNFYAMGSGLTNFVSSQSGNTFDEVKLPSVTFITGKDPVYLSSIRMINSTWEDLSFWSTYVVSESSESDEDDYPEANAATFTKVAIPATLRVVQFEGSTASNLCAAEFVMAWIDSIAAKVAQDYPSLSGDDLEAKVLEELADYTLQAENISWGTSEVPIDIYYSDLARFAALNNGNNQNANLMGYIKIADSQELTSIQTSQLMEWFGDSVFNKSNMNSGLIIDQELSEEYIQINIGRDAYIDTIEGQSYVVLEEGHSATLNATKFLLSDDDNIYDWNYRVQVNGAVLSITEGNDGVFRLVAGEGTAGDYIATITANIRGGSVSKSVDVYIKGVTYPEDWRFGVDPRNGVEVRKFTSSSAVIESIFGAGRVYQSGSNSVLRDIYVLYGSYQDFEFYAEPVNGQDATATYKKTEVEILSLDTTGNLARTNTTEFIGDGTFSESIDENYLYYTNSAYHNGIVLGTKSSVPSSITRYIMTARITIGGKTEVRYLNLMMVSDSSPIVRAGNTVLYRTLSQKLGLTRSLYKTDLIGIEGTLQFPSTDPLGSLITEPVDNTVSSIFKYLPNVSILNLSGCTFAAEDDSITESDKRILNVSNMTNLSQLILTGALISSHYIDDLIVDVSQCANITSFVATGTSAGIKAEGNALLATVTLGSPYYVYLKNTSVLTSCTATSTANFSEVHIENVNTGNVRGLNTFNTLFP